MTKNCVMCADLKKEKEKNLESFGEFLFACFFVFGVLLIISGGITLYQQGEEQGLKLNQCSEIKK